MSRMMPVIMMGALLAGAVPAFSQYRNDRYGGYRNDDGYYRQYPNDRRNPSGAYGGYGGYGRGQYGGNVINRVQSDLSRVASYSRLSGRDRDRAQRAISELSRFESKWQSNGRFDKGHLDRAIDNMNDLLRSSNVAPRELDLVRAGRDAIRDFRSSEGRYSTGGSYGSYRPW